VTVPPLLSQVEQESLKPSIETIAELSKFASNYPYYKYDIYHVLTAITMHF
jgi:hypothetical protein